MGALSERTVVVVEFPLGRMPTKQELRGFMVQSYQEAKKIIGPGKVLGIVSSAVANRASDGQTCFVVRLAVEAPEAIQKAAMN